MFREILGIKKADDMHFVKDISYLTMRRYIIIGFACLVAVTAAAFASFVWKYDFKVDKTFTGYYWSRYEPSEAEPRQFQVKGTMTRTLFTVQGDIVIFSGKFIIEGLPQTKSAEANTGFTKSPADKPGRYFARPSSTYLNSGVIEITLYDLGFNKHDFLFDSGHHFTSYKPA
jgi:hypothetical protein